jgi:hypothetical protein
MKKPPAKDPMQNIIIARVNVKESCTLLQFVNSAAIGTEKTLQE